MNSSSGVDALCDDVLSLIFTLLSASTTQCDSLTPEDAPWVLSYVCRRWRALVLSTPLLWNALVLNVEEYDDSPSSTTTLAVLLDLYLQRSADVAISVEIHDNTYEEKALTSENREWFLHCFIALLIPSTHKWRELALDAPHDIVGALSGCSFDNLRILGLSPFTPVVHSGLALVPWYGIRYLSTGIHGPIWLPRMPNLEEWHLYASGACPSEDVAETVSGMTRLPLFDLPLLRIITLNGTPTNGMIDQLSRCLHAPALETLGLCIGRPAPHLRFPMFANAKKLINLSIDVKYFWVGPEPIVHYNDSTIPLLLHSPNVTNLHLGVRSASPAAIEAIRFGAVPKLKTLRLHFATMEAYPEHILCTLEALVLRSRTHLSELVLDGYGQTMGYGRDVSFRDAGYQKRWLALGKVISVHSISSHRGFNDQS